MIKSPAYASFNISLSYKRLFKLIVVCYCKSASWTLFLSGQSRTYIHFVFHFFPLLFLRQSREFFLNVFAPLVNRRTGYWCSSSNCSERKCGILIFSLWESWSQQYLTWVDCWCYGCSCCRLVNIILENFSPKFCISCSWIIFICALHKYVLFPNLSVGTIRRQPDTWSIWIETTFKWCCRSYSRVIFFLPFYFDIIVASSDGCCYWSSGFFQISWLL